MYFIGIQGASALGADIKQDVTCFGSLGTVGKHWTGPELVSLSSQSGAQIASALEGPIHDETDPELKRTALRLADIAKFFAEDSQKPEDARGGVAVQIKGRANIEAYLTEMEQEADRMQTVEDRHNWAQIKLRKWLLNGEKASRIYHTLEMTGLGIACIGCAVTGHLPAAFWFGVGFGGSTAKTLQGNDMVSWLEADEKRADTTLKDHLAQMRAELTQGTPGKWVFHGADGQIDAGPNVRKPDPNLISVKDGLPHELNRGPATLNTLDQRIEQNALWNLPLQLKAVIRPARMILRRVNKRDLYSLSSDMLLQTGPDNQPTLTVWIRSAPH